MPRNQKGLAPIVIVLIVVSLIIIVGGYLIFFNPGFLTRSLIRNTPSATSQVPASEWSVYKSEDPKFSIRYPSDWSYEIKPKGYNPDNIQVVSFTPKTSSGDSDKINAVVVRVLDKKDATSLQDWVQKYATPTEEQKKVAEDNGYAIFAPTQLSNQKIGDKDVLNFTEEGFTVKAQGYLVASDKNVFIIVSAEGKATSIKEEIIKTLEF